MCSAIGSLHALETLSITGSRVAGKSPKDTARAMLVPPLDLRQNRRLRAAAFINAVPAALRLPANGCRSSVTGDAQTLHDVRSAGRWRYGACAVHTEDGALETGILPRLLARQLFGLTLLKITCGDLAGDFELPGLRELHICSWGRVDVGFTRLRLTSLSICCRRLEDFEVDSTNELEWCRLCFLTSGPATFLEPLLAACRSRGLRESMQVVDLPGDARTQHVNAYIPAAAEGCDALDKCACDACHCCLRASGAMHVEVCQPKMPTVQLEGS